MRSPGGESYRSPLVVCTECGRSVLRQKDTQETCGRVRCKLLRARRQRTMRQNPEIRLHPVSWSSDRGYAMRPLNT